MQVTILSFRNVERSTPVHLVSTHRDLMFYFHRQSIKKEPDDWRLRALDSELKASRLKSELLQKLQEMKRWERWHIAQNVRFPQSNASNVLILSQQHHPCKWDWAFWIERIRLYVGRSFKYVSSRNLHFHSKCTTVLRVPFKPFAEVYQTQSYEIYKQVKAAARATEYASIQRDQAFARENALSEEVIHLHTRLQNKSEEVRGLLLSFVTTPVTDWHASLELENVAGWCIYNEACWKEKRRCERCIDVYGTQGQKLRTRQLPASCSLSQRQKRAGTIEAYEAWDTSAWFTDGRPQCAGVFSHDLIYGCT